jgi:hypothetical protein
MGKKYQISFAVWEDGKGWQPHDIASRYTKSFEEAIDTAAKMIAICEVQVIAEISLNGKLIKEMGWD